MKNITFGNLIEKLLYISNQKKSSLAKFIGYDVSYINKWILSTYLPSSKRINEICKNISDFILDSLDESSLINLIDYFEIPADSSKEFIGEFIETMLKEVYIDTVNITNKSVQNLPKSTHSEEYYNSFSMVKPNIIYNTFFNELNNMADKEDSLEILVSLSLMYLNHKDKITLSDLKEILHRISKKTNVKISFLIGFGGDDNEDDVINTLLGINLIASYPCLNFKIYNCKVKSNTVAFAIKDKFLSTNIFFEEGECLFSTNSKDRRLVEEFYSNIKYTLKNKGNLLFYRKEASSMIEDQTYIQYIMNNDLRCLLGSINEFFMPPDLFMEIAERLFGHNQKIINELKKINLFLHNVTYKSKLKVLIHESELRKYMSSGKLHFFNTPVTLTFKERERHIEYIEYILKNREKLEIRLVEGHFIEEFADSKNPSLYLSKTRKLTTVNPEGEINDYLTIRDKQFGEICDELFDIMWNDRKDIVIDDRDDVLEKISKSRIYVKLINERFNN